ncbi:DUF2384 domain-containing protein [Kordiimonas lipolytica]|uniref:DUF2384 domain-containing protein n=1 Tax=Kordiimonas lipolytica TaxID=1662421 RepID=A0ABV8UE05_9PROT|nr:DUF2384 domain-containing protein [Kordiimonas lipolytica]
MSKKPKDKFHRNKVGIKMCFRLAEKWNISDATLMTLLGQADAEQFEAWRAGDVGEISNDTLMRVSYMLGTHTDLRTIFTNPNNYYGWVSRSNSGFEDISPLEHMLRNGQEGMHDVRLYLNHWISGGKSMTLAEIKAFHCPTQSIPTKELH